MTAVVTVKLYRNKHRFVHIPCGRVLGGMPDLFKLDDSGDAKASYWCDKCKEYVRLTYEIYREDVSYG